MVYVESLVNKFIHPGAELVFFARGETGLADVLGGHIQIKKSILNLKIQDGSTVHSQWL